MRLGRVTIGLFNSYDHHIFREAHRRVLARAGALALAFDQNLVTFGFPFPDGPRTPREVADWVADTTSIGEDGLYLRELSASGRFHSYPFPGGGIPPQLGDPVLTTSRPDPVRRVEVDQLVELVLGGGGLCLLFGLGSKGVPASVHRMARYHLEITGSSRSLETCTAMGAVSAVMAHMIRRARDH